MLSFKAKSQCTVTVITQGTDTLCEGTYILLQTETDFAFTNSVIDQEQTNYNGGMSALTGADRSEFQTFVAGITGTLVQIDMGFFNYINGVGVVNLFSGNGITGTLLDSQTVTVNCPSGNCMISFPENTQIITGNAYTFQFVPGAGMPYPYGVQVQNPGTYNNGELFITDPSGTYPTGMDMVFATHVGQSDSLEYLWSTGSTDSSILAFDDGTYYVTVTGSNCSAIDSINITVISIDTSVTITGNTLTTEQNNATYQWVNCDDDFSAVSGATNQSFTPATNGSYAVEISQFGCNTTTSCYEIAGLGINNEVSANSTYIYPNPASDEVTVLIPALTGTCRIHIINALGQELYSEKTDKKQLTINLQSISKGIYFIETETQYVIQTFKLIKY